MQYAELTWRPQTTTPATSANNPVEHLQIQKETATRSQCMRLYRELFEATRRW